MSMMTDGLDWLADELNTHAGTLATLKRGAATTTVTVVSQGDGGDGQYMTKLGNSPEETVYAMHPPEQGYCAFVMKAADYKVNGVAVLPARGDKIVIGSKEFWLSAPDGAEPWRYHPNPNFQTWLWLHTKLNAA